MAPDVYEQIRELARAGNQTRFKATHQGVPGVYQVAEHFNFGRGWLVWHVETGALVRSTQLTDVQALTYDSPPSCGL